MKYRAVFGMMTGILLILSSLAHAFLGWPPIKSALTSFNVDQGLIGAITIGWYFGSVAMFVFGIIVFNNGLKVFRGDTVTRGTLYVIAIAYIIFGLAAFIVRDYNPHFLFFIAIGSLVGIYAFLVR